MAVKGNDMSNQDLSQQMEQLMEAFNQSFGVVAKELAKSFNEMAANIGKSFDKQHIIYEDNKYFVFNFEDGVGFYEKIDDTFNEIDKDDIPEDTQEEIIKEMI